MTWFRVDDTLTFHSRVMEAGNAAVGVWVRAGAWSMAHLTDGFIPTAIARSIGSAAELKRLVASGLWEQAEGGYQFHAWAESSDGTQRQPTREQVLARRKADRERKADHGRRGGEAGRTPTGTGADSARNRGGVGSASGSPVPSRPVDPHVDESSPVPERASGDGLDEGSTARREAYWRGFGVTNPTRLLGVLAQSVDRPISEDQAIGVVAGILSKSKQRPKNAQRYLESAIQQSWAEIQQEFDEAVVYTDERDRLVEAGIEPPALEGLTS